MNPCENTSVHTEYLRVSIFAPLFKKALRKHPEIPSHKDTALVPISRDQALGQTTSTAPALDRPCQVADIIMLLQLLRIVKTRIPKPHPARESNEVQQIRVAQADVFFLERKEGNVLYGSSLRFLGVLLQGQSSSGSRSTEHL